MDMVIIYTPAAQSAAGVYHAAVPYCASAKMADNQTMHKAALRYFAEDASALSFCMPPSGGVISLTAPRYAKTKYIISAAAVINHETG